MRSRSKIAVLAAIGALALAVLARGIWIARARPVRSDNYIWGAFHVHSTLSDGLASLPEIARQAREARVDLVLLSEHGRPHREAARLDENIDGVRFVGGSEVGIPEGHLIVIGVDEIPDYNLPPFPPDAVADVAAWGGLSVLTYPEDPTQRWLYWEEDFAPDAIEIINVTSYFRASSILQKLDWAVFSLFNPYYYVSGLEQPGYALARWDELLTRGRVWGLYASNAHGGFPLTENTMIPIPSYEAAFSYVGIGIDRSFAADPMEAIRSGRFFSIVRGAGEPERFEVSREGATIRVDLDAKELTPRIVLKHEGAVAAWTDDPALEHRVGGPGIYRVEVYLEDHPLLSPDVPWILSNPIFVDMEPGAPKTEQLTCDELIPIELSAFHIEKDDESNASIEKGAEGDLLLTYDLSRSTPERVDRWVALAKREPIDLAGVRGVYVESSAPAPMRYWIELREGERGFFATFKADSELSETAIPWRQFYPTLGAPKPFDLTSADAMFVSANTSSSKTGFSASLTLNTLALCR